MPPTVPIKSVELPRQDSRAHYSQLQYSGGACLKHSSFLKVKGPQVSAAQLRACPVAWRSCVSQRRPTTSFLTATTLIYATGAGITAAAGTRLALQSVLAKNFTLCSLQSTNRNPSSLFLVTTSLSQDWVICAPAAFLRCGSRSQAPSPESNPNSPSPVTAMVVQDTTIQS